MIWISIQAEGVHFRNGQPAEETHIGMKGEIEKEVGSAVGEISAIRPPLKVELVRDPTQVLLISHGVGGLGDKRTEGREPEMVSHFPKH